MYKMKPNAILHLTWIKQDKNKNFIPREGNSFDNFGGTTRMISYFDSMNTLYNSEGWINSPYGEVLAERFLRDDKKYKQELERQLEELDKELNTKVVEPTEHFITINCRPDVHMKVLEPLVKRILKYKWVMPGSKAVMEYHGSEGNHAHAHMKIINTLAKQKTIEKIWAARDIKTMLSDRQKVDHKFYVASQHDDYILGIKREEKIDNVELDRKLRDSLGIPHLFEK